MTSVVVGLKMGEPLVRRQQCVRQHARVYFFLFFYDQAKCEEKS